MNYPAHHQFTGLATGNETLRYVVLRVIDGGRTPQRANWHLFLAPRQPTKQRQSDSVSGLLASSFGEPQAD